MGYYHQRNNITMCEVHFTLRQSSNGFYRLFVSKFVFYVVLFELMVKKITVISFATIIGSYRSSEAMPTKQSAGFVLLRK